MTRFIIIGTGVAGFSCAQTLRSLAPEAGITLVGDDPFGYYSRPGLAYYLTGEIPEKQLFPFSKKGKLNLDVQYLVTHVTRIDPASHTLETEPAGTLGYDRLLIATGAHSIPVNFPGADLHGVVTLDDLADTRSILSLVRHTKTAVVVGGGVLALELVEGLIEQGVKVHYLLRGDWYWSNLLVEAEARLVEKHLTQDGVILHHCTEINEIIGKKGKVRGVRTAAGELIRCDMVGVGIGVKARTGLAQAAGLKTDRGILVDEYLQTTAPDVFAAGDVAQIFDPGTGRATTDNLWHPGRKQGRIAAHNMAGQKRVYPRSVAVNVLRLAGVMTTIIGAIGSGRDEGPLYTTRGSSETWQPLPNTLAAESITDVSQVRLILGEDRLLGALVMGDQKISRPLCELINERVDIRSIKHQLLQPSPQLGKIIMEHWAKMKNNQ
jgi:NADPH-dependent 2,4-dienoyl-CoA reductase/sulfur reductase-like enzyme